MTNKTDKEYKLKSSILSSYTYNSTEYILTVTYNDGESYMYKNIMPPTISNVFDSPGSIGSKFIRLIRSKSQGVKQ